MYLNLRRMQVHSYDMVGAGDGQHVGDEFRADRCTRLKQGERYSRRSEQTKADGLTMSTQANLLRSKVYKGSV